MDRMKRKDLLNGTFSRARWFRLIAKLIDVGLVIVGGICYYPMGLILGLIYLCIADSLYDGQSIGKRLMGFGVVSLIDGTPCNMRQSFLRNLPVTVPIFFLVFPFWGWIFSGVFTLPMTVMEVYFLFSAYDHKRLGDILADTTVIADDGTRLDLRKTNNTWYNTRPLPVP